MAISKIIGGMGVTLWADTRPFEKGLKQTRAQLSQFSSRSVHDSNERVKAFTASMAKGKAELVALGRAAKIGAAAGLYVAARAANEAKKSFEELNTSMQRSLSVFGKVSKEMRASMTDTAIGVSRNTLFSASQSADAFRFIGSAGYSAEQSQAMLPKLAEFAQAGQFDLSAATNFGMDAQAALGLKTEDTAQSIINLTRITDVLTKANILSNAEVEDFSKALTTGAAAAMRLTNKEMEEGVAVLAAFAEQGIKGENAGTAFSIVMRDLQTKAIKNASAFKKLGVEVFDSSGKMNHMADIISEIETAIGGMSDQQEKVTLRSLGFADKSVGYTQSLLGMSDKIRGYEEELRKAGGTTKEVSDSIMTDAEKAVRRKSAAWQELSESIGGATSAFTTWVDNQKANFYEAAAFDPGKGMTVGQRLSKALPWNFDTPILPGSPQTQAAQAAKAQQSAARKKQAADFWKLLGRVQDDPRGTLMGAARPFSGGLVSQGIKTMRGYGRFAGNLVDRTQDAGWSAAAERSKERLKSEKLRGELLKSVSNVLLYGNSMGQGLMNKAQLGGRAVLGLGQGINSLPGLLLKGYIAGAMYKPDEKKKAGWTDRPSLSLSESGSPEAYRQQAAIRRQSEDILKKSLKKHEEIARGIASIDRKMMPGAPLGLA